MPLDAYIKLLIEAGDDLAEAAEALYQGYSPQIAEAYNAWRALPEGGWVMGAEPKDHAIEHDRSRDARQGENS